MAKKISWIDIIIGVVLVVMFITLIPLVLGFRPRLPTGNVSINTQIIPESDKVIVRTTATSNVAPIDSIYYILKDSQGNIITEGRIPNTYNLNTFTADINIIATHAMLLSDNTIVVI
jgi:hypothetical protein